MQNANTGGPIPIPYPNIGKSSDTSSSPSSVKNDGQMPMTKAANYMMSTGDEAGAALGVMSSKIKGPCEYMLCSFDVKYEGKNVYRLGDPLFHNDRTSWGKSQRHEVFRRDEFDGRDTDALDSVLHRSMNKNHRPFLFQTKHQQASGLRRIHAELGN